MSADPADETTDLPPQAPVSAAELMKELIGEADTDQQKGTSAVGKAPTREFKTDLYVSNDPFRTQDHTPAHEPKNVPNAPNIPGYEIQRELGRGGMGVVYQAEQIGLNRTVALKMILAGPHASPVSIQRFFTEAQAVARFQHPNIIQIFDIGEHVGMPYFSLELAAGGSLAKKVARSPQLPKYAAEIVIQLAWAMDYAHTRGVVHRDLKPANILLSADGTPKIADFGLAKLVEDDSGATQSGQVLGSPSYMSPEQARGEGDRAGPPADIYALGAILYDLLTGRPPFSGSSVIDTLEMVRTREPVPPRDLTANIPLDVQTICLKCLEKDPAKRYPTAQELADDLQRWLDGRPIQARPISRVEKSYRWAKRNPLGTAFIALTALIFIIPSLLSWQLYLANQREAQEKQQAQRERDEKEIARQAEETAKLAAIAAENQAKQERDEREKARLITADQRRLSLDTIRGIAIFVDNVIKNDKRLYAARQKIFDSLLGDLRKVTAHAKANPLEDRTEAVVYSRVGEIFAKSGQIQEAQEWFDKAYKIIEKIYQNDPTTPANVYNLSAIKIHVGNIDWQLGRGKQAFTHYVDSLKLRQQHLEQVRALMKTKQLTEADEIRSMINLAEIVELVGFTQLRTGQLAEAEASYQQATDLLLKLPKFSGNLPYRRQRCEHQVRLGDIKLRQGDRAAALRHYQQALADRQELLRLTPKPPEVVATLKTDIAQSHLYLGDFYLFQENPDWIQAEKQYQLSHQLFTDILKLFPDDILLQQRVAALQIRVGLATDQMARSALVGGAGTRGQIYAWLHNALAIRNELGQLDPKNTVFQVERMLVLARLGRVAEASSLAKGLQSLPDRDLQLRFQIACGWSLCAEASSNPALVQSCQHAALAELTEMIQRGWRDRISLRYDPDLAALQSLPAMKELLAQLN